VDNGIGAVHYARGDYVAARRAYEAAQSRTADRAMRGKIILNLGVIENIEGDLLAARDHYERAYALFLESEDVNSAMLALHNRGMVEADLARWEDADRSFIAALDLATASSNSEMIAKTLVNRSEVLVARGEIGDAVEHCERALRIYDAVGDEVGRGEALRWRAHALGRAGEHAAAERSAGDALQIAIRSGARLLEAESARELGLLRTARGDREGARRFLQRAYDLFAQLGARREADVVRALLGPAEPDAAEPPAR
jgi:tetratricopeptide (TPR) repeat protein